MIAPGKYDVLGEFLIRETNAKAVVVIIADGELGSGATVKVRGDRATAGPMLLTLADVLERLAGEIRADARATSEAPMTDVPADTYANDAQVAHETVIDFRRTFPDHRPSLECTVPDSVFLGTIDQAIANGVVAMNDDGVDLAHHVAETAPRSTFLMLFCAWELVYPELAKKGSTST